MTTAEHETLATYLDSALSYVDQFQTTRNHTTKILNDLDELKTEAMLLDDSILIYESWKTGLSVELHSCHSTSLLKELHGTEGEISKEGSIYTISEENRQLQFILCKHGTYTPILDEETVDHLCLRC